MKGTKWRTITEPDTEKSYKPYIVNFEETYIGYYVKITSK